MKEADIYRKFWQAGLHDNSYVRNEESVIIWQLFFGEGEEQVIELIDEQKDAEKTLCNKVETYLKTHQKSKLNLLVFSTFSPTKDTCDYFIKNIVDKLSTFHWCFVALRHIQRPSCAFHNDSYFHNVPPDISQQHIESLKALSESKVQLSTFKIETWSYLRGYLKLSCVLPNCLGRSYDKTFGHKVHYRKETLMFKYSRMEEDNNMADDLKQILQKTTEQMCKQ